VKVRKAISQAMAIVATPQDSGGFGDAALQAIRVALQRSLSNCTVAIDPLTSEENFRIVDTGLRLVHRERLAKRL
jgi:hypothetical protein